jgi:hypothetical protein
MKVEIFGICKRGFEKGDMSQQPLCHQFQASILNWFQCFFTQIQLGILEIMSKVGIPLVLQLLSLCEGRRQEGWEIIDDYKWKKRVWPRCYCHGW